MKRTNFETKRLPVDRDDVAPDGSDVRVLLRFEKGSMAHFELPPGKTSKATANINFDEIWYFLSGRGEMWRKQEDLEEVVPVDPGVCLTIPAGSHFQFRSFGHCPLAAIGVTMPPWTEESIWEDVKGIWESDLP